MPYRVAADVLKQVFPIDAGKDPETVRRHTLKIGATLRIDAVGRPEMAAAAVAVTLDSTFIRSCEDGERHLEVRVGNVETEPGGRQVFSAVAKTDTDVKVLICRSLDAVGRPPSPMGAPGCGVFSPMPASASSRFSTGFISACASSTSSKQPAACRPMIQRGRRRRR
jgi:hypothetical protein